MKPSDHATIRPPKAPPSIAATSTLAMVRTAESRGFDASAVLTAAGIDRGQLDDPDARLPAPAVLQAWNALREGTGDPALQLVAPTSIPFGSYRVVDYLVGASATVGEGVDVFARFFRLIADAITLTIERGRNEYCLRLATGDGGPVPAVYVDYVFAALVSRVRMRIKPGLKVLRVELQQPKPVTASVYDTVFGAPVRFRATADRLCFSSEEWASPLDSADALLARLLEEHARMMDAKLPRGATGFGVEVQKAIASKMVHGGSAIRVAKQLNVSVRTLQRKLAPTGTTFREVSESVRGQLAQEYLRDPAVSIAEVAVLLGFSDQTAFTRAFRRWTGDSPGRWRRRRA